MGDAAETVLGSPHLVTLILTHLARPQLGYFPWRQEPGTRRAASQVNKTFRQAALCLPWATYWNARRRTPSPELVAALSRPRYVQLVEVDVCPKAQHPDMLASLGALLAYARATVEAFSLVFAEPRDRSGRVTGPDTLDDWLRDCLVQLQTEGQGLSVPACLCSLPRLTSLELNSTGSFWKDGLWLTALEQLRTVTLMNYAGPAVFLPHLESTDARICATSPPPGAHKQRDREALEDWVAPPMLTALSLSCRALDIGSAHRSAQGDTEYQAHAQLTRPLQRLELVACNVRLRNTSLRAVFPCLTYLALECCDDNGEDTCNIDGVLSQGLPLALQELSFQHAGCLAVPELLWSSVCPLVNLTCFEYVRDVEVPKGSGEIKSIVKALTALPRLQTVYLTLDVERQPGVERCFRGLESLLRSRGGNLVLEIHHI